MSRVSTLLAFVGTIVGGYAGWWLGGVIGFELMGQMMLSIAGSAAGVFGGRILAQRLFS